MSTIPAARPRPPSSPPGFAGKTLTPGRKNLVDFPIGGHFWKGQNLAGPQGIDLPLPAGYQDDRGLAGTLRNRYSPSSRGKGAGVKTFRQ